MCNAKKKSRDRASDEITIMDGFLKASKLFSGFLKCFRTRRLYSSTCKVVKLNMIESEMITLIRKSAIGLKLHD